jgi:pyrroline-5-carboxylate reductase
MSQEDHLDVLTPISGCGPAYFFLLAEIMVEEAVKLGLDLKTAHAIVRGVFIGSASLVDSADFAFLRESVSSKGGVTEAALTIMAPEMRNLLAKSLQAATTRLKELQQ